MCAASSGLGCTASSCTFVGLVMAASGRSSRRSMPVLSSVNRRSHDRQAAHAGSRLHQGCAGRIAPHVWRWNNIPVGPFYLVAAVPQAAVDRPRPEFVMTSIAIDRRPAAAGPGVDPGAHWLDAYRTVRAETERRAAPLSAEDQVVQSMPDASPTKWHRAHTTWFFEQFLLKPHAPDYRAFDQRFAYLFNSYYVAAGPRHARPKRGLLTRPHMAEVAAYRAHVDAAVETLIGQASPAALARIAPIVEIGLNHEQQHQELMLTDILHAFAENPTAPAYDADWQPPARAPAHGFVDVPEGIRTIGHDGNGFAFDNEGPAHRVLAGPVRIARGLVTNLEWLAFMEDGGYATPSLWLSDGWAVVEAEGW